MQIECDAIELNGAGAGNTGAKRSPGRPVSRGGLKKLKSADVFRILENQGFRCNLTGRELTPETASLDHRTALSKGGEHVIENVQVLHKDVNLAKGSMSQDEFVAVCRDVVAWVDANACS